MQIGHLSLSPHSTICTQIFRDFVTGFGIEFYPLGGDPRVLSEFVVKHRCVCWGGGRLREGTDAWGEADGTGLCGVD